MQSFFFFFLKQGSSVDKPRFDLQPAIAWANVQNGCRQEDIYHSHNSPFFVGFFFSNFSEYMSEI